MHGVINLLFEEDFEFSDLVELGINDDELSYYYKRSNCSFSKYDSEDDDVVSYEIENKVFDKVFIEDQHARYSKFYDEYFNVMINPFVDCEESMKIPRLSLDYDMDDIGKYKFEYSFNCQLARQRDSCFQGVFDLFPEFDSMHNLSIQGNY